MYCIRTQCMLLNNFKMLIVYIIFCIAKLFPLKNNLLHISKRVCILVKDIEHNITRYYHYDSIL